MKKSTFDVSEMIHDYTVNKMGIYELCDKYHTGKLNIKSILKFYGVELRKPGGQKTDEVFVVDDPKTKKYIEREGYHFEAVDEKCGFRSVDYMNQGGYLTSHIEKEYGVEIPSLYHRQMYYKRTGNYWWEQWFKIEEVKNLEVKKCPYCDWTTKDTDNRSGAFMVHLQKTHGMTRDEYLKEHPEDKEYFALVSPILNRQMSEDENDFVVCQICGKKVASINGNHLKKHGIRIKEYMDKYGVTQTTSKNFHDRLSEIAIETNKNMERSFSSAQERDVKEYVESFGFECRTDRKILNGKEIDILIPEKSLGIEYNGNLWHSEKFKKGRTYHYDKMFECKKQGINLIQIFEDEYFLRKEVLFSKIRGLLGVADDSIASIDVNDCDVREIAKDEATLFLESNHLLGFTEAMVYIGAYYDGMLISVLSLSVDDDERWKIIRYADDVHIKCDGLGAKMFDYFVEKYKPSSVMAFADMRWIVDTHNSPYTEMGLRFGGFEGPSYTYYNPKIDRHRRFDKSSFKRTILSENYGFPLTMTEKEMAEKLGYTRIWDCGSIRYTWDNPNEQEG